MSVDANGIGKQVSAALTPSAGLGTAWGSYVKMLDEYGVAIGLILTLIFGLVNLHYNRKEDKRREREHDRWNKIQDGEQQKRAYD